MPFANQALSFVILGASFAFAPVAGAQSAPAMQSYSSGPSKTAANKQDTKDVDFASRGFIATRKDPLIKDKDGKTLVDLNEFKFLAGAPSPHVEASLLRQAKLLAKTGLFKVVDGVYQVRGFDVANITFIRGKGSWVVIDTLSSPATAKAAYDLLSEKVGRFPISAVIYTHSHADHFGGTGGIISQADVDSGRTKVIAPAGFMANTLSEWLIVGNAMLRRAQYQGGVPLPRSNDGYVSFGIGDSISKGAWTLIAPTVSIEKTGTEMVVDGVRLVFQVTPGTEAPAEMNIDLPDLHVLDLAENANNTMHNILPPRGAQVRDADAWTRYLAESVKLYGATTDVVITSHGWPRFGNAEIHDYLVKHMDAYKYLHDQTVRMINAGMLPDEIANRLSLPDSLASEWYNRGYYGSMSFNSRAIYQRYMGWYDGNPAHLAPLDPADRSHHYVDALGGADKVLSLAKMASQSGNVRWAVELLNDIVTADASNKAARTALAELYQQMGYAEENALWRNMYLTGAQELRIGVSGVPGASLDAPETLAKLPTSVLLDLFAIRLIPGKVSGRIVNVDLEFPERNERVRLTIENSVLKYQMNPAAKAVDATATLPRVLFLKLLTTGNIDPAVNAKGNLGILNEFSGWFEKPNPRFSIVSRN